MSGFVRADVCAWRGIFTSGRTVHRHATSLDPSKTQVDNSHNIPISCFWVSKWVVDELPKGVKIPLYTELAPTHLGGFFQKDTQWLQ
jgi:hypothetical protein